MNIDADTMNEVFQYLKIKKTWDEVTQLYINWADCYKHDRYQSLTPEELVKISEVYEFGGCCGEALLS